MSRRKKLHIKELPAKLVEYAASRSLDYEAYSPWHMRIMDGGFITLDAWTTGRYYILMTDYLELVGPGTVERGGEKGELPIDSLDRFLDGVFFPEGMSK